MFIYIYINHIYIICFIIIIYLLHCNDFPLHEKIYIKCNCTYTCFQKALYSFSIATSYVILFLLVQFILDLSSYTYKLTTEYNNFITLISKKLQIYIYIIIIIKKISVFCRLES